ncbi:hypothetical protein IMG5_194590 [Ichthyophthirius multifiliis]|uniref:Uncharacterized protein n=1 Tax=Ichthyophthirius multifiliis TaxID=5932 RepID=G0R4S2_ICHMU|nr:hypothetical protein IMG5_194590 [Ichthyophthirius multifiliis]EGR27510.1 hypothetical protein IMG5_194590 [Ichthyophthirius multifiliis]|eukprot:XP_004024915.1 hypothetical protein IMG5_194590 [Ichthyophthirius multifiliis]
MHISNQRFSNLEEKELRKRVFTGESNTMYRKDIQPQSTLEKRSTKLLQNATFQEKLIDEKHEVNATAIAETQFVGFDQYNKQTLEGKVDLEKVREIRRAIRRRYANRTNFQKIFNYWDYNSTGSINTKNAYDMIKKMGIKINYDECRVLIASSDQDQSGDLNLNEFMDLIFNSNDTLNVNLKSLPVISEEEYPTSTVDDVLEKLNQDAQKTRLDKHVNQMNVILKNKLPILKIYVLQADSLNQGFVSTEKYQEILKKLAIPESILSKKDIQYIFDRHKIDEYKFDYKNFIDYLKKYEFVPEDIYVSINLFFVIYIKNQQKQD